MPYKKNDYKKGFLKKSIIKKCRIKKSFIKKSCIKKNIIKNSVIKKITDPTLRCHTSSNMSVFCAFVYVTSIKVKASWCKFFSIFRLNFKFQCTAD